MHVGVQRLAVIVSALIALTACASGKSYEELLQQWVGASERELVSTWGAPDAAYTNDDGSKILTWRESRTEYRPGEIYTILETHIVDGVKQVVPITRQDPGYTATYECTTNFIVGPNGVVQRFTYSGNGCLAFSHY